MFNPNRSNDEILDPDLDLVETTHYQTPLTWNDRANLRGMLKHCSQTAYFDHDTRDLALRIIGELDQLLLEF